METRLSAEQGLPATTGTDDFAVLAAPSQAALRLRVRPVVSVIAATKLSSPPLVR